MRGERHGRDELPHVAKLENLPRLNPRASVVVFSLQDPPFVDLRLDIRVLSLFVSTKMCSDLAIHNEEASVQDRMVRLLQVLGPEPCLYGRPVLTCSQQLDLPHATRQM